MENNLILHQIGKDAYYNIWHKSSENMLLLIHEGDGAIVLKDISYPLTKGALCFIGAGTLHYTLPTSPRVYDRSKLFFDVGLHEKISDVLGNESNIAKKYSQGTSAYVQLSSSDLSEVAKLFDSVFYQSKNKAYFLPALICCYLKLLLILDKNSSGLISAPSDAMSRAIDYINENISKEIKIDNICAYAHISKYYFCRKFRNLTGLTVMQYVLKTRLTLAKEMLVEKNMPVGEISDGCGFSSIAYFCRTFKENTGLTPLQYRKENK